MVSFTYEKNIICRQTQLDDIAHEQNIICRQLFAGHVVGFRLMKRKKNLHRMIIRLVRGRSGFILVYFFNGIKVYLLRNLFE